MTYISTFPETMDLGTAQFIARKRELFQEIREISLLYTCKLQRERQSETGNPAIIATIEHCIEKFNWLLNQEIVSDEQLDFAIWLFNSGKLRTENELNLRQKLENQKEIMNNNIQVQDNKKYRRVRKISTLLCTFVFLLLPSLISFIWAGFQGFLFLVNNTGVLFFVLFCIAQAFSFYIINNEFGFTEIEQDSVQDTLQPCFAAKLREFRNV
ncbi:MAG: hypothetical protein E7062_10375 [Spirochaetaceae bacterium]|nr:hypothetical protein [Spirochaetaceae bacterium]